MTKIERSFQNLDRAVQALVRAVSTPPTEERDFAGIIQSFEFSYELTWKTLKLVLEENGVEAPFPRIAFEEAFKRKMIAGNAVWKEIADARNLTSHTYDQNLARLLCKTISEKFITVFTQTVETIRPFVGAQP